MWLCIDQGGHSTRAVVADSSGELVARATAPIATHTQAPDRVEHDPRTLLASVKVCIDEIARELGGAAAELRSVAVATQRSTLTCASRSTGEALVPMISWQDRRGHEDLAQFDHDAALIKRITGLRLSPHYGVGKLRWCLRHVEAVRAHQRRDDMIAAPLATYLTHALCVERPWVVDPVNASRMLLMELREAVWSAVLLARFDVPRSVLPDIRPCRSQFGTVEIGAYRVPLTVLTGDQAAAIYAFGEPRPGTAFVNIGTGAFVQAFTGTSVVEADGLLSSIVWLDEKQARFVLEGTVNGAGSAIDAVSEMLGLRLDPSSEALQSALARIAQAPLYLNGVSGLGSPDWRPSFSSRFIGDGDAAAKLAAAYESIGFLIYRNVERMRAAIEVDSLVVTGGLAQLDWLLQLLADLSGVRVIRPANIEATLAGLLYLAGGIAGTDDDSTVFEPRAQAVARSRYRGWTTALESALAEAESA